LMIGIPVLKNRISGFFADRCSRSGREHEVLVQVFQRGLIVISFFGQAGQNGFLNQHHADQVDILFGVTETLTCFQIQWSQIIIFPGDVRPPSRQQMRGISIAFLDRYPASA